MKSILGKIKKWEMKTEKIIKEGNPGYYHMVGNKQVYYSALNKLKFPVTSALKKDSRIRRPKSVPEPEEENVTFVKKEPKDVGFFEVDYPY